MDALQRKQKEGIALVLVLGFLSILIMLALAFSISMRTERLASEVSKDEVQTRLFMRGALERAMADVDDLLYDYDPDTEAVSLAAERPANLHVPKKWAIIESLSPDPPNIQIGSEMQLIAGSVTNWIPQRYIDTTDPDFDAEAIAEDAEWIFIRDPKANDDGDNPILGRYAFLCFDCTGQIDVHQVGKGPGVVRGEGLNPYEIDAELLPEVTSGENLSTNLGYYHRFATLPEIRFLNDGSGEADAIDGDELSNLAPYSLCYDKGWWDWAGETNSAPGDHGVSGNITNWTDGNIGTLLENVFLVSNATMRGHLVDCYRDYVDTDFVPKGLDQPSSEPMPMINEISIRNRIEANDVTAQITYSIFVEVELWYPYRGITNDHDYTVSMMADPSFNILARIRGDNNTWYPLVLVPTVPATIAPVVFTADTDAPFVTVTARYDAVTGYGLPFGVSRDLVQARLREMKDMVLSVVDNDEGGAAVDRVQPAQTISLPIVDLPAGGPPFFNEPDDRVGMAVNDPRWNHDPDQWDTPTPTPGEINHTWDKYGFTFNQSQNGGLEGTNMYARNGPLKSVAEIGFLVSTGAWTTIDLFSGPGREMLTKFRDGTNQVTTVGIYTNGLINPNSTYPDVIQAVFSDVPINDFIGDENPPVLDNDSIVEAIADSFMVINTNVDYVGKNSFDSRGAWVTINSMQTTGTLATAYGYNNSQREAIIRNSYKLFNPNQNLFTFVVVAQAINDQGEIGIWEEDLDSIIGEQRCVAVVWRDPFPHDADGFALSPMDIRLFKYLTE